MFIYLGKSGEVEFARFQRPPTGQDRVHGSPFSFHLYPEIVRGLMTGVTAKNVFLGIDRKVMIGRRTNVAKVGWRESTIFRL